MKPFSISVCISPAALGANVPFEIVQALNSFSPAVKNLYNSKGHSLFL
jgi:hypothetical protein